MVTPQKRIVYSAIVLKNKLTLLRIPTVEHPASLAGLQPIASNAREYLTDVQMLRL